MYPSQDARYAEEDLIANINFDIATFAQCKVEIETLEQYVEVSRSFSAIAISNDERFHRIEWDSLCTCYA